MQTLRTSFLETHYPPNRRKNVSGIDIFMRQISSSFLTFVDQQHSPSVSPSKRKIVINDPEESIRFHYKKIHELIDNIDQQIILKLQHHQNQVFSIVKNEIQDMKQETSQMVEKLNQTIKNKNTDDEIWRLGNELDYFKAQTFKLFQDNKSLRKCNSQLKRKIKQAEIQRENGLMLMQKMKRKLIKNDLLLKKTSQIRSKVKKGTLNQSESAVQIKGRNSDLKRIVKTQIVQPDSPQNQELVGLGMEQSIISIKLDKGHSRKWPEPKPDQINLDDDPLADVVSVPSYNISRKKRTGDTPKPRIIQIDTSYIREEPLESEKKNKQVQTQDIEPTYREDKVSVKMFSKTGGVNYHNVRYKKEKHIDLIKGGFHVRSYNQRSTTLGSRDAYGYTTPSPQLLAGQPQNPFAKNISKVFKNNRIATEMDGCKRGQRERITTVK